MRSVWALIRSSWLSATSYRVRILLSFVGLVFSVVPLYFVASALDPVVGQTIQAESEQYFPFVLIGLIVLTFVGSAISTLPGQISSGITTGTLEALITTRTSLGVLLVGLMGYPLLWTGVRSALMLLVGSALGVDLVWTALPLATVILALIVVAHVPFGILSAAFVLAFRTSGPLSQGVLFLSGALGGVYYSVDVIPSWLQNISDIMPMTYGLRALRQVLLLGAPFTAVWRDIAILAAMASVLLAGSMGCFWYGYRYARRAGTLTQY